jgi:hypothetical protein
MNAGFETTPRSQEIWGTVEDLSWSGMEGIYAGQNAGIEDNGYSSPSVRFMERHQHNRADRQSWTEGYGDTKFAR